MIELKNVTKIYEPDVQALDNVSLSIKKGSIFGIIGLSGAGKSTLIRTINGLEKIDQGEVFIDGHNIQALTGNQLLKKRQDIGMIFQNFNLLTQQSVYQNVYLPLKFAQVKHELAHGEVLHLLELVGLKDKLQAYPAQLSGGQQQRVAIARALANQPSILLVDEATSALDPQTTLSILDLLKQIHEQFQLTIVVITHEMDVIEYLCTEMAILDQGQVVERGQVADIFKRPSSIIGKKLIYPKTQTKLRPNEMRITFNQHETVEPIIASMILETQATVSILHADMRTLNHQTVGQLIIECPDDEHIQERMCQFLIQKGIQFERGDFDD